LELICEILGIQGHAYVYASQNIFTQSYPLNWAIRMAGLLSQR